MLNLKMLKMSLVFAASFSAQAALCDPYNFVDFSFAGGGENFYFKNEAGDDVSSRNATFFTIPHAGATNFGASMVNFSFLQPTLAGHMSNLSAVFSLSGSIEDVAAQVDGVDLVQSQLNGTFSFLTASDITLFGRFYAAGANLLSGTLTAANLYGPRLGDSANIWSQSAASDYSSDFLSFAAATNNTLLLSLTSLSPALQANPEAGMPTTALRSFGAVTSGIFSSDVQPTVDAVPEPQTWTLAILGFAMVGFQLRQKRSAAVRCVV